jgi:hypothetical protein
MPNPIFQNMLSRYEIKTKDDSTNALHEVMQQIALAGLYHSCPQGQNVNNRKCNLRLTTKHNQPQPVGLN